VLAAALPALAEGSPPDTFAEYRAQLGEDNPAELWETRGEALWTEPRGPNSLSLAGCDLGLGTGVIKGVYTVLPRYFADTHKVQDLESRLLTCMTGLQGLDMAALQKSRFGDGEKKSDLEALAAYIVAQSQGVKMKVPFSRPEEKAAYAMGKQIFFRRSGTHDFACATCHSQDDKRVRLQDVPNLTTSKGAQAAYTTWPAYRVSQGELRTMEWRITDCFRQQRLPELKYGSDVAIALTMYMAKSAEGGVLKTPAIKR
jgi:sulfur-oxidizing protein SoxA